MNLKAVEIAKALGTIVDSQNIIKRVSIDSRDVDENTLFFAIKGERFDGHDFVKDVAEKYFTNYAHRYDKFIRFVPAP